MAARRYGNSPLVFNLISHKIRIYTHPCIILYVLLTLQYLVKLIKKCLIKGFQVRYPALTRKFEVCFTVASRNNEIAVLICQRTGNEKCCILLAATLK